MISLQGGFLFVGFLFFFLAQLFLFLFRLLPTLQKNQKIFFSHARMRAVDVVDIYFTLLYGKLTEF
nr:MAG: hypothetical protein [Bacteriophage sp.]